MRAIELNIVFVDDEGSTHTVTLHGDDAEFWFGTQARERLESDLLFGTLPRGEIRRNVLRKVTEVEGAVDLDMIGMHYVADEQGCIVGLMDRMYPPEVNTVGPRKARKYRLRFDVTAVPVPEVKP